MNALQRQLAALVAQKAAAAEQNEILQKELKKASKALLAKTEECERALAREKAERQSGEARRADADARAEAALAEAVRVWKGFWFFFVLPGNGREVSMKWTYKGCRAVRTSEPGPPPALLSRVMPLRTVRPVFRSESEP